MDHSLRIGRGDSHKRQPVSGVGPSSGCHRNLTSHWTCSVVAGFSVRSERGRTAMRCFTTRKQRVEHSAFQAEEQGSSPCRVTIIRTLSTDGRRARLGTGNLPSAWVGRWFDSTRPDFDEKRSETWVQFPLCHLTVVGRISGKMHRADFRHSRAFRSDDDWVTVAEFPEAK